MNKKQIEKELEYLKEQAKKADIYSHESILLSDKIYNLRKNLELLENVQNSTNELEQIFDIDNKIKDLEKTKKELEQTIYLKNGLKKDVIFKYQNDFYKMTDNLYFRKLKKDKSISIKESAKSLYLQMIKDIELC